MKFVGGLSVLFILITLSCEYSGFNKNTDLKQELSSSAWSQVGLRGMGYVTGINVHPTTHDLVFARTDVGGIFRWIPNEQRWKPLMDGLEFEGKINIASIALDPNDPKRLCATYGAYLNKGTHGLMCSYDQGETWHEKNLPKEIRMGANQYWRWSGERLRIDPNDTRVMYLGTRTQGLYRSHDGGNTWERIANVPIGDSAGTSIAAGINFVAIDPSQRMAKGEHSKVVYLGISGKGVYRSVDGGSTFAKMENGPGAELNPIQGEVSNEGDLYLTSTIDGGPFVGNGAVYRYSTGIWTNITPPMSLTYSTRAWVGLGVHPQNPKLIAVNSMGTTPRDLFVTEDGGASWTIVTSDRPSAYPQDQFRSAKFDMPSWLKDFEYSMAGGIQFAPTTFEEGTKVWLSTGFGVLRANDLMAETVKFNGNQTMDGLEELVITQVEGLPPGSPGEFATVVMDQSGFIFKADGSIPDSKASTHPIANGTGIGFAYQDPRATFFVGGTHHYEAPFASVTWDGGSTFTPINPPDSDTFAGNIAVSAAKVQNMVWVPADNEKYPGEHPPMHTANGGKTWTKVVGLPMMSNPISNPYFHSKVIAADTVNSDVFYYFEEFPKKSRLYRSDDGGLNFFVVNETLSSSWKVNLKAAPNVEGEVWLGQPDKGLWISRDAGLTFTEVLGVTAIKAYGLGAPLPGQSIYTVYVVGKMSDQWGIYYSSDRGKSWMMFDTENKVPLFDATSVGASLQNPGRIMVGIAGRGLFRGELAKTR